MIEISLHNIARCWWNGHRLDMAILVYSQFGLVLGIGRISVSADLFTPLLQLVCSMHQRSLITIPASIS